MKVIRITKNPVRPPSFRKGNYYSVTAKDGVVVGVWELKYGSSQSIEADLKTKKTPELKMFSQVILDGKEVSEDTGLEAMLKKVLPDTIEIVKSPK